MKVENFNQVSNVGNVSVGQSNSNATETRVDALKGEIAKLEMAVGDNNKTIETLAKELRKEGIRPNGALSRGGVRVSNEPGKIGKLETRVIALQNKVCGQNAFIGNMQRQLDFNAVTVKTDTVRKEVAGLESEVAKNEQTIEVLKGKLKDLDITPNPHIRRLGVRVSSEAGKLGELETQMFGLRKEETSQKAHIAGLQEQVKGGIGKMIEELNVEVTKNEQTIEGLRGQLREAGIRPNGFLRHFVVRVSSESGELGKLETQMFKLEKDVRAQDAFINNMKRQMAEHNK